MEWERELAGLKLAGITSGPEKRFVGLRVSVASNWRKLDLDDEGRCL